jgi:hypothetical protein
MGDATPDDPLSTPRSSEVQLKADGRVFHMQSFQEDSADLRVIRQHLSAGNFLGNLLREIENLPGDLVESRDSALFINGEDAASEALENLPIEVGLHSTSLASKAVDWLRICNIRARAPPVKEKPLCWD